MAAASYSSQVQQRVEEANQSPNPENTDDVANPTTPEHSDEVERLDEAIQNLPPELREKIYKDYASMMQREREEKGWKEVHEVILQAAKYTSTPCMRSFEGCTFCREVSRLKWNGLLKTSSYYDEMID